MVFEHASADQGVRSCPAALHNYPSFLGAVKHHQHHQAAYSHTHVRAALPSLFYCNIIPRYQANTMQAFNYYVNVFMFIAATCIAILGLLFVKSHQSFDRYTGVLSLKIQPSSTNIKTFSAARACLVKGLFPFLHVTGNTEILNCLYN
jgi:hypothetical protein